MQYPGNNYYPAEAATANPPSAFSSYNWASAPPYGESTAAAAAAPAYYPPPDAPVHAFDPPNYGYNPHYTTMPSTYANSNVTPVPNPNSVANPNYVYDRGLPYPAPDTRGGYGNSESFQYPSFGQRYYDASVGKETNGYDNSGFEVDDGGFGGEVYAYDGGRSEPYGARGTVRDTDSVSGSGAGSKPLTAFDDYGNLTKITKAVPKADTHGSGNGVQKYRVKILPDSGSQSSMDVLCQIGLDGIRMLDPNTTRTLRIYPLENITKWEVADPSVYSFWAKSAVDIEARRIRLQSNRYTTSTILDTVAAACVQFREMAEDRSTSYLDTGKTSEQASDRKKGSLADWIILKKPLEEKQHWVPDEAVTKCTSCGTDFGAFVRRHHCRNCGDIFCDKCTQGRIALTSDKDAQPVRVCDRCVAEVTQRLSTAKDKINKSTTPQTHDDLAKRLLEEMGKTRKMNSDSGGNIGSSSLWSSELNSDGSGKRTREIACPTCTVHLQVPVPSSGTETVECGVCQHPFLVSAR